MLVTCSIGRTSHQSLILYTVARLDTRWRDIEDGNGLPVTDTLIIMANLALTYWNQGRWDEAEKLEMDVMNESKRKLGLDHPDTLTSMANLASTYRDQGRWDEAEKLQMDVMNARKTKLGLDHPDTLVI